MKLFKEIIDTLFQSILGIQKTIKLKEYMKKLYRYPTNMIGRKIFIDALSKTDVLVFAAHPDDEILGLSATMSRHMKLGEKVTVVYVTDGSGRDRESWRRRKEFSQQIAKLRYEEGAQALSIIGIAKENLICLGFPDGGTHRYLKEIAKDIQDLISKATPKKIYVHCIEGGHNDHDLVSLVVRSVCRHLEFQNVYEWAEYSPLYPLGTEEMKFLSRPEGSTEEYTIRFTSKERLQKRQMLACHQSQDVEDCFMQGEIIRKANLSTLNEELNANSQVMKEEWFNLINLFVKHMENKRRIRSRSLKLNQHPEQSV